MQPACAILELLENCLGHPVVPTAKFIAGLHLLRLVGPVVSIALLAAG